MELDIADIQWEYPNPRSANDNLPGIGYCVGGAFCLFANENGLGVAVTPFPCSDDLSFALQIANPALDSELAFNYAEAITGANDNGDFHEAWQELDAALAYGN